MSRVNGSSPFRTALLLGLLSSVNGCVTDPVTGQSRVSLVRWSAEEEIEIGKEYAPNVESQFDAIQPDPDANRLLGEVIQEMVAHSVRKDDYPFRFKILNSSVPNAFVLPGGYVYITRGLIEVLESEGQFISVMGHELGHVEHQHSMRNQSRGRFTCLLTAPLRGAVSLTRGLPGERIVGLAAGVAGAPLALWGLKYNRGQELEADVRGVFFAAEMGYDPREGIKTFEMFERLEQESQSSRGVSDLAWFRSHPLNRERIDNLTSIIERDYPEVLSKPKSDFRQDSPGFPAVIERFKSKSASYKLYEEAVVSIMDPDVTEADFTAADKKLSEALAAVPDEPLFLMALGEAAISKDELADARSHFEKALAVYQLQTPGDSHWKAHFYLGILDVKAKQAKPAIEQLELARSRYPLHPAVQLFLGFAYELGGDRDSARAAYGRVMDLSPSDSGIHVEARDRLRKL